MLIDSRAFPREGDFLARSGLEYKAHSILFHVLFVEINAICAQLQRNRSIQGESSLPDAICPPIDFASLYLKPMIKEGLC